MGTSRGSIPWLNTNWRAYASLHALDAGILDVKLKGLRTFPLARTLTERRVQVVFSGFCVTGVPADFASTPVLAKPFRTRDLEAALGAALDRTDRRHCQ